MAVKPGVGKRLSREEHRRALWNAWTALTAETDAFGAKQAALLNETLQQSIGRMIMQDAAAHTRLGDADERAYDECARLFDTYRAVINQCEQERDALTVFSARRILDGIHAVLSSRLRSFEDATEQTPVSNPVAEEKRAICEKAAAYAARRAEDFARLSTEQRVLENAPLFRRAFIQYAKQNGYVYALEALCESTLTASVEDFYMYYRDGLRFCLAGLNDLHQRKAARYYIDLMESEWEVLGPIMKVQAAALEYAVERGPAHTPGHGPSPEEQAIVHRILTRLREGYQCFGRAVDETRHLLSDEEPLPPTEPYKSFDLFAQTLSADNEPWKQAAQTEAAALFAVMDERRTVFFSALDKETDALFEQEQMAFFKAAYRFQRMVSEEIFMTEEITDAFERLRRELPSVDELPAEIVAERDILRGIAETVDIKIESIKESVYAFNADGVHLVNDFTAGSKDAGYDDTLNAYNQVLDRWMTEMPETSVDASTIFFEQCAEQEPFAEHRRYYEKREAEYAAKINKLLLNYKKDTLLYEVSTYEEILTYSVSRLRACAAEDVARSVVLLDETLAALEMILKKNNIQVIRPSPHTPFNGREHEVLVAEKQEGFAKAEIIKTINSGYRQKDIVILRANVIAAR